jgi:hypothetical protein
MGDASCTVIRVVISELTAVGVMISMDIVEDSRISLSIVDLVINSEKAGLEIANYARSSDFLHVNSISQRTNLTLFSDPIIYSDHIL